MPKKGFLSIVGVIVFAAIVLVGVYYVLTQRRDLLSPDIKTIPKTEEPIKDSTADWKTYTNEKYGFEFKYDPNWKIIDKTETDENIKLDLLLILNDTVLNQTGSITLINYAFNDYKKQFTTIAKNTGSTIDEKNFSSDSFSGVYYVITHKNGNQIDYIYDVNLSGQPLRFWFISILNQPNKKIDVELLSKINKFALTLQKVK
ncbi:hypothetical protein HYS99_00705 [Candidatus Giovannonibacteria bacterium]|nr:hypothetical protein [Candidatus Giovannonibacteria bacterium]